jgi:hypothetical protein
MERRLREPRSSDELKREAAHHRELHLHPGVHAGQRMTPRTEGSDD